jgi:hypothetical protein
LNVTSEFVDGKAGAENIINQLAGTYKAELEVKAKALIISFDAKDSAVRRWTPQAFYQRYADRDAEDRFRDTCQKKLRQMWNLFRVTTSDNIAEVLGVVSELDTVLSRVHHANVAPALSALCLLRMNEEAARVKQKLGLL